MSKQFLIPLLVVLVACCCLHLHAAERGAADWLPSEKEPVVFRGDYTGVFPGAKPPLKWDERTG